MGKSKKNKDNSEVVNEIRPEFAKDVLCNSVSENTQNENSEIVLEAPEVFLDFCGVAVDVSDRTFENVSPAIRDEIYEVSKTSANHSMKNTELFRTMSAKIRARKVGKKTSKNIKTKFNIV